MARKFKNIFNPTRTLTPNPASAHTQAKFQQAWALHQKGQLAHAQSLYEEILKMQPEHYDALHLLGVIAGQTKNYQRAITLIDTAIRIQPNNAAFYANRGNVLQELKQLEAAVASYDKAIALKPNYAEAYANRGNALQELKQLEAAVASYDKAIALKPDLAEAYWSKSLALLLGGDFVDGWKLLEWRWSSEELKLTKRNFPQPRWLGKESLAGKSVLLHSEQGLGDTIQFCRYTKLVSDSGARVILEVPKSLFGLLNTLSDVSDLVVRGSPLPAFDYHCPLLSLPFAFNTNLNSIPRATKYLSTDSIKLTHWTSKLGEKRKPRIGLAWSGRPEHKNDHNRSIVLAALIQHLPADYQYVSLQKEVRDIDKPVLESSTDILHFGNELDDFADTAALCELVDVVITVDTSVAHLGGALGKPTWVLLPFSPDWRWLLDRNDSPWYPSVKLYRQPNVGDWSSVFDKVKADIAQIRR